jgi:hypothetical protein
MDTTSVQRPVVITLNDLNCSATKAGGTAEATINARSIGDVTCRRNGATTSEFDWIDPTFAAPGNPVYQVMRGASAPFDLDTNPGYGPLAGVWQDVGVDAFWGFQTPGISSFTATFTVSIRKGAGAPVLDTATWTISITETAGGGGGGGGGCFTGNMLVLMANGTEKRIADIFAGEEVMSLDVTNNKLVSAKVQDIMVPRICNIYELRLSNGKVIETTIEHPFRTADGRWANIDTEATYVTRSGMVHKPVVDIQLAEGMLLRGAEESARIMKIVDTGRVETVYNLSRVGAFKNYFVEGMCVHNVEFVDVK